MARLSIYLKNGEVIRISKHECDAWKVECDCLIVYNHGVMILAVPLKRILKAVKETDES